MRQFALKGLNLVNFVPVVLQREFHFRDITLGELLGFFVNLAPVIAV